jgi:hypothetical protein
MGRITDRAQYTDHVTLVCKNHPAKHWHTKNIDYIGARSIFFSGEDTTVVPFAPSWKESHPLFGGSPVRYIKARLNGVNPFDERIKEEPVVEWDDLLGEVESFKRMGEKYSFECACPARDLILWPGYESRPVVPE